MRRRQAEALTLQPQVIWRIGLRCPHAGVAPLSSGFPLGSYWDTDLFSLCFPMPIVQSLCKSCTIYLKPNHFSQVPFHSSQVNVIFPWTPATAPQFFPGFRSFLQSVLFTEARGTILKHQSAHVPPVLRIFLSFSLRKAQVPTMTHKALHSPCPLSALSSLPWPSRTCEHTRACHKPKTSEPTVPKPGPSFSKSHAHSLASLASIHVTTSARPSQIVPQS